MLGVIYVDSREPGHRFTELDLEILEALAEHAALVLAGLRSPADAEAAPESGEAAGRRPALMAELQQRLDELVAARRPRRPARPVL